MGSISGVIRNFFISPKAKRQRELIQTRLKEIDEKNKKVNEETTLILNDTTKFFEDAQAVLNGEKDWMNKK